MQKLFPNLPLTKKLQKMKKTTLQIVLLVLVLFSFSSQILGQHLSENFSSGWPPQGWTIDAQQGNWSAVQSSNAGGSAPEARFSWTPQFNSTSRLISPSIDLTGVQNLTLSFKHAVDHYSGTYTVGVATRSNNGSWNTIWSSGGANVQQAVSVAITNADVGSANFQFCFFFSGNSYNINYWYIDDVVLYTPYDTDIEVFSINVSSYSLYGTKDVATTVKNIGINPITSFSLQYQIDEQTPIVEEVTGVNITTGSTYTFTFSQTWEVTPGVYNLSVNASNINGAGDDDYTPNNTLNKNIHIASQSVANLPLFESFTSSTCPPCYTFNTNTFTPFLNANQGQYAIIKYQMNWPGSGDPYYTAEGGVRRTYYGVSAVPQLFTGGVGTPTNQTGLNNAFAYEQSKPTFFSLNASAYVSGNMVHATINVLPHVTVTGFKVRAAIVENVTTGNVGSNGETSFKYVMMKMLPDANGTTVNLNDGENHSLSFSQDMSGTFVEEMSDLTLVVFIQNDTTKEIFQSIMVPCALEQQYPVIFTINNELSEPIAGATVSIGAQNQITDAQGQTTYMLPNGTYSYSVNYTNYYPTNGSITVADEGFEVNVTMEPIPLYTVTFNVTDDEGAALEGANIQVNGLSITTDSQGVATIELQNGDYPYTVSLANYYSEEGSFTVLDEDLLVDVTLSPVLYALITFNISDINSNPVEGAIIIVAEETLTSDQLGVATVELMNGEYDFTVSKEGFIIYENSFTVVNEDITIEVTLTPIPYFIVTFTVLDEAEEPIEGALVEINGEELTTDELGIATIELTEGEYLFVVSKTNYETVSSTITVVDEEVNVTVELSLIKYILTFNVSNESQAPIEGASIAIYNQVLVTGSEGTASVELPIGVYEYLVSKDGYITFTNEVNLTEDATVNVVLQLVPSTDAFILTFNFENQDISVLEVTISDVTNNQASIGIKLPSGTDVTALVPIITISEGATISPSNFAVPTNFTNPVAYTVTAEDGVTANVYTVTIEFIDILYLVTFNVTGYNEENLEGATISIEGFENPLVTNASGIATIELPNGSYNFAVNHESHSPYTDNFIVSGAAIEVNVQMVFNSADFLTTSGINLYPNPTTGKVIIDTKQQGNFRFDIHNSLGHLVYNEVVTSREGYIELNINQPSGVYLVKVTLPDGRTFTNKLIVR